MHLDLTVRCPGFALVPSEGAAARLPAPLPLEAVERAGYRLEIRLAKGLLARAHARPPRAAAAKRRAA